MSPGKARRNHRTHRGHRNYGRKSRRDSKVQRRALPETVTELVAYLFDGLVDAVIGSWQRVLQLIALICLPAIVIAVVVVVLFELRVDQQGWLIVAALAGTVTISATVAKAMRLAKLRRRIAQQAIERPVTEDVEPTEQTP